MRPCLVDFLVKILRPETLYLTLNIVDGYVSRRIVFIKHYQLVGCAALWIAAKLEDAKECVPIVQDLVQMWHDAYEEPAFIQMEGHVLSTIQWTLGHPTVEAWLRPMEFVKYAPSSIALAELILAQTDECLEIVDLPDRRLAKHANNMSETLIKKYSDVFYSETATVVVQYYLQGGKFIRIAFPIMPATVLPCQLLALP
ncbi:cyclin-like protein [Lentinula raphanica]|nr:cyclin-like protein [Lentinula raphanica]